MILTDYDEEKTMEMFKREFREDGYSEGLQAGYDKGSREGRKAGYDEGAREGEERGYNKGARDGERRIAINMKASGMPDKTIAELLKVTPERLKEILSVDKVHE